MSKDVMDELASKLGAKSSQQRSYRDIINQLQSSGLNQHQLEKKLNEELSSIASNAESLEKSSKFKDAANLYFEAGIIVKEVLDESSTKHHDWIVKSSNCLVALANEYIAWGGQEIDRAAASLSIANLIYFLTGKWELLQAYNEFNAKYKDQIQQGKTAAQSLWVPYDLVTSVTQLNSESLQRAESFAQTALLTQSEPAKTFHDAVQTVLANAREAMVAQMKLPNIESSGSLPKDIVFGEHFFLDMSVENIGEGFANDVKLSITKMDGLNLVNGSYSNFFKELEPNSKGHNFKLEFVVPSGEGEKERLFNIKGNVEYYDVLANKRINPIGPYPIVIRAFKKADELKESLQKVENSNKDLIDKITTFTSSNTTTTTLVNSFKSMFEALKSDTLSYIQKGEYPIAENRIELFKSLLQTLVNPTLGVLEEQANIASSISTTASVKSETDKQIKNALKETESALAAFETKWKK